MNSIPYEILRYNGKVLTVDPDDQIVYSATKVLLIYYYVILLPSNIWYLTYLLKVIFKKSLCWMI